ncbi:hypothetical protein C4568_01700 [Candidatus Parcubacteria bacterium]|nr:MAG: hypothetical protein C4568_01700 [Candidatus Parcubacteria bacterium]
MKTSLTAGAQQAGDEHIQCEVQVSQTRFKRIPNPEGPDSAVGNFFLKLDVTALQEAIYIPISIASGKKPTGFVYQIEGTAEGEISTTDISCRGEGVSNVTLGTLLYAKIPVGSTATFRIQIEMKGKWGKEYKIVINRVNYKLDPSDARYKKFDTAIGTKVLKLR